MQDTGLATMCELLALASIVFQQAGLHLFAGAAGHLLFVGINVLPHSFHTCWHAVMQQHRIPRRRKRRICHLTSWRPACTPCRLLQGQL